MADVTLADGTVLTSGVAGTNVEAPTGVVYVIPSDKAPAGWGDKIVKALGNLAILKTGSPHTYPEKSSPVNADSILLSDSEDSNNIKKVLIQNLATVPQTSAPTLSTLNQIVEGTSSNQTISNYSATTTYTIQNESNCSVVRTDDNIEVTVGLVTADTPASFEITAQESGETVSSITTSSFTILNITIVGDDAVPNVRGDGSIIASGYLFPLASQGGAETDWAKYQNVVTQDESNNIMNSYSNPTVTLNTLDVSNGDVVYIVDGTTVTEHTLSNVVNGILDPDGANNTSTTSIVPTKTANDSSIFSSSVASTSNATFKAFNNIFSDGLPWYALTGTNEYIGYIHSSSIIVNKYTITSANTANSVRNPKDFELRGSNDTTNGIDGTWAVLDSRIGETSWTEYETRTFTFINSTPYKAYKLFVYTSEDGINGVAVIELEIIEAQDTLTTADLSSPPANVDKIFLKPRVVTALEATGGITNTPTDFDALPTEWQEDTLSTATYSNPNLTTTFSEVVDGGRDLQVATDIDVATLQTDLWKEGI